MIYGHVCCNGAIMYLFDRTEDNLHLNSDFYAARAAQKQDY